MELKGLYYHYAGCIHMEGTGIHRIIALSGSEEINLGVCLPIDGNWITKGKIPQQQLDLEDIRFAVSSTSVAQTEIIPIDMNRPIPYLELLSQCRFAVIDNKPVITIPSFISG